MFQTHSPTFKGAVGGCRVEAQGISFMDVLTIIENHLADGLVLDRNGDWVPIAHKLLEEKEWLRHLERGEVLVDRHWTRVIHQVKPDQLQRAVKMAMAPESGTSDNFDPIPEVDDQGIPLPPKTQLIKVELMDTRLIETIDSTSTRDNFDTAMMSNIKPSATVAIEPSANATQVLEPSEDNLDTVAPSVAETKSSPEADSPATINAPTATNAWEEAANSDRRNLAIWIGIGSTVVIGLALLLLFLR